MRIHGTLLALAALTVLMPAALSAQRPQARTVYRFGQRGMLGIVTESIPPGSLNARQQLVVDVVAESPAAKAGVTKGDTLLSINDLAASHQVMSLPFEPGDTVVLRVRRDGRERDITVVAAERFHYRAVLPDSIRERVSVVMGKVLAGVDTMSFPRVAVRRLGDDSTSTIIIGSDTMHVWPGSFTYRVRNLPHDSVLRLYGNMRLHADTFTWHGPDSTRWHVEGSLPRLFNDSMDLRIYTPGVAGTWGFPDSTFMRGFDILTTHATLGLRAIAGAELAPMNPGLSEYFGTTDGLLVLNAREGTPAARAGLRAGDVIVRAGDTPVRTIAELRRAIERMNDDGDVMLRVVRRGQNVDVTLGR